MPCSVAVATREAGEDPYNSKDLQAAREKHGFVYVHTCLINVNQLHY